MEAIKNIVTTVLSQLMHPESMRKQMILEQWPQIVGEKLKDRTKPTLTKAGRLYIWVDESALAFEINQRYRPTILKRVQSLMGEETVKEIRVRVGQLR